MEHAKLVRLGTDLLAEAPLPERWLPQYDLALASENDQMLVNFVNELGRELNFTGKIAA